MKKILTVLLSIAMLLAMMPIGMVSVSAAGADIPNLHRGVLTDGEYPSYVYWDAVEGASKYVITTTIDGKTYKNETDGIYNDYDDGWHPRDTEFLCGNWIGYYSEPVTNKTVTVQVTAGYDYGNLFVEVATGTITFSVDHQIKYCLAPGVELAKGYSLLSDGNMKQETLWEDEKIGDAFERLALASYDGTWDTVSGYSKFQILEAPDWVQLWSNYQDNGWLYKNVTISFEPPAGYVGRDRVWINVKTSETDGFVMHFDVDTTTERVYEGTENEYFLQELKLELHPELVSYWDIWGGTIKPSLNDFRSYIQDATVIQGYYGTVSTNATRLLSDIWSSAPNVGSWKMFTIDLENGKGTVLKGNDVITAGAYRYRFNINQSNWDDYVNSRKHLNFTDDLTVYVNGELVQCTTNANGNISAYGPWFYIYDEKPEINSVTVNNESVADGGTITANNGTVTVKTNYDGLSDALKDYGCSVKQLAAYYLNGEKINVAMINPVDNGDGTATKTYTRTLNPGDELRGESWLEVKWPDGSTDRVDEHTVTVSGPSRQFITQPHYVGDGMQAGENYVAWKLNFTPVKLIARYNLGTAARPNWKEVELDATKSRASLPAISQKYTLYAFYGTGARDYVASDAFSATDPVEFTPAFTLQPANGVSLGGAYAETTWATNFTPMTLALVKINYAPNGRPLYTYEELDVNATYCTIEPGFDEYCIYAYYNDTQYVASNKFIVTEMNYYNAWFYVDDTVLDKVMVLEGDYVERPADPIKDGYTFDGWYTDDGEAYNFAAPVTDDVHLTAWFEQNESEYIDTIHIEGLSAPQYGQVVKDLYKVLEVAWETGTFKYSNADKLVCDDWDFQDSNHQHYAWDSTDTVAEGSYYWAIYFNRKAGYAFADDLTVTVDGVNNANIAIEYDGDDWAIVYVKYEVTNPAEPPVGAIPGDVNEDGKVNIRDLGLVQQSLNGWNVTLNTDAADVNGDGKVNIRDLGLIQQYLNGWNVELK